MPSYRVRWEIDLDAETPREAAQLALKIHRDPGSQSTVFDVDEMDAGETVILSQHIVDLEEPA